MFAVVKYTKKENTYIYILRNVICDSRLKGRRVGSRIYKKLADNRVLGKRFRILSLGIHASFICIPLSFLRENAVRSASLVPQANAMADLWERLFLRARAI